MIDGQGKLLCANVLTEQLFGIALGVSGCFFFSFYLKYQIGLTLGPVASPGHRVRGHRGLVPPAACGETAAEGAAAHGAGRPGRPTWNIQVIALKRFVWSFGITPLGERGCKVRE